MSLLPCADGVVLSGGYAKMYEKGKKTKGVALEDTWMLRCVSPARVSCRRLSAARQD